MRTVVLYSPPYKGKVLGPPAGLLSLAAYLRARKIIRQQRRAIADLHDELYALRTLPLDAPSDAGGGLHPAEIPVAPARGLLPR